MTPSAPWWGVPAIAGGFLVLGVFLGFVSTYVNDRRKFQREDQTQFRARLLDVVADFLEAWRTMLERRPSKGPHDNDQRLIDIDEQLGRMLRAEQLMELLAPDSNLSSKAANASSRLDEYCDPNTSLAAERDYLEIGRLRNEAWDARAEFLSTARVALGHPPRKDTPSGASSASGQE